MSKHNLVPTLRKALVPTLRVGMPSSTLRVAKNKVLVPTLRVGMPSSTLRVASIAVFCILLSVAPASAYVDLAPSLGRVMREAQTISVFEVDRFSPEKGAVILKKVCDLKGKTGNDPVKHQLIRSGETAVEWPILDWAEPGRRCVLFISPKTTLACIGQGWYQVHAGADGWWKIGAPRTDLPLAYYGTVSRLSDALTLILADKSAIITTMPHGGAQEGASFDLALNRPSLPGLVKVQRIRAHANMPAMVMAISTNPAYLVGMGPVDEDEIPSLREKLQSSDATDCAESAADLGSLGPKAATAAADLAKLLDDPKPMVQMAAAAALLRVAPGEKRAIAVLAKGLTSEDGKNRRLAARAAGCAGASAAPLAKKLGALMADPDVLIRRTALQAIATLGPAAGEAAESVIPLLDKADTTIDAADALGRLGPAARAALKPLAKLLTAEAATVRWAGVRAMSQIGGNEAKPAVKFMIRELPKSSLVDRYNMMIYLALLGPVAKEAIPAIQSAPIMNPVLKQTTTWAIEPGDKLPWLGGMGNADFAQWIMESYVIELGDHLKPTAQAVAKKIMDGSAGNVPRWGYKLLAKFPQDSLAILTPGLEHKDLVMRERSTVALGYMGQAAAPAKEKVNEALAKAKDEREQLLLRWCLREIK